MKIVSEKSPEVPVNSMKDGQIAIFTKFGTVDDEYVGAIGQRYGDAFVFLGKPYGQSLDTLFKSKSTDIFVRILPAGTVIEI